MKVRRVILTAPTQTSTTACQDLPLCISESMITRGPTLLFHGVCLKGLDNNFLVEIAG